MAGIRPQSAPHEFPLIVGIFQKTRELRVGHDFEREAEKPNGETEKIQPSERRSRNTVNGKDRRSNEKEQERLQEVHLRVRTGIEPPSPLLPPCGVTVILGFPRVPRSDMPSQTQSPRGNQGVDQKSARRGIAGEEIRSPCQKHESKTPCHVGYVVSFPYQRDGEPKSGVGEKDRGENYGVAHIPMEEAMK